MRLIVLTLLLCSILIGLLFAGHLLGTLVQPSAIINEYQCTQQPCWHGIYPQTTSIAEAESILRADKSLTIDERHTDRSFGRICWIKPSVTQEGGCLFNPGKDGYIAASAPESPFRPGPLTFADAINLFGTPSGMRVCYDMTNDYRLFVVLYFQRSILVSGAPFYISQATGRVDLDTAIDVINYHINPASALSDWKGFVPISGIRAC